MCSTRSCIWPLSPSSTWRLMEHLHSFLLIPTCTGKHVNNLGMQCSGALLGCRVLKKSREMSMTWSRPSLEHTSLTAPHEPIPMECTITKHKSALQKTVKYISPSAHTHSDKIGFFNITYCNFFGYQNLLLVVLHLKPEKQTLDKGKSSGSRGVMLAWCSSSTLSRMVTE